MAFIFNRVDQLLPPFSVVDEQMLDIPAHGQLRFNNTLRKIVFMLEGDCVVTLDGRTQVRLGTNDLLLVDRACWQAYTPPDPDKACRLHVLRLVFDPKLLPALAPGARLSRQSKQSGDTTRNILGFVRHYLGGTELLAKGLTPEIRECLAKIRRESEDRGPGYRATISALGIMLVTLIGRHRVHDYGQETGEQGGRRPAFVVALSKSYIMANLSKSVKLQDVAWHVGWSEEHFCRVFRTVTGVSPAQYIRQTRLELAKNHLLGTKASISQIAEKIGFSSLSVFSRCFRRYVGRTPQDYREQERFGQLG